DGIRDFHVTGVQTCALPIWLGVGSGKICHVFSLLAAALVGVLALGSAAGGLVLAAGILIVQFIFALGAVRVAPVPAAAESSVLRSEERRVGEEGITARSEAG